MRGPVVSARAHMYSSSLLASRVFRCCASAHDWCVCVLVCMCVRACVRVCTGVGGGRGVGEHVRMCAEVVVA